MIICKLLLTEWANEHILFVYNWVYSRLTLSGKRSQSCLERGSDPGLLAAHPNHFLIVSVSLYSFFLKYLHPRPEFFVEVCLNFKLS